jgi:phenylacetate-CoA ligase
MYRQEEVLMIYNEEFETMPREALEAIQVRRLQAAAARVYNTVPFYRKRFDEEGVKPDYIRTLDDLRKLPFTHKDDLRDNYPFGMFAVPMDNVVRIHASSGTTGKPTVVGYTARDVQTWAELMARTLMAAGASKNDIVHNAYGYGLFTGGLGFHYGAEKLGASVIPISGGNTRRQVMIMKDFGATILTCTPSYALHIAEVAEEMGVSFRDLKFKAGVFGAEPWTEQMRQEIERKLNLKAMDIYGLSEIIGPGVSVECIEAQSGLHVFEDHFIPEIIDPRTEEVLPYGTPGELVFTTITKEAFPVIRYRTRDISILHPEPCRCGRTMVRMGRVQGRSDDMLIIRGVNVFPSQIESVIMETEGVEPHYQLVVERVASLDQLTVLVEVNEKLFSDEIKNLQAMGRTLEKNLRETLGVAAEVKLVEPKTIQRSEGKAVRVVDQRKL